MSFKLNWIEIANDEEITNFLLKFLNDKLCKIKLPQFISDLSFTKISLGEYPPELIIRHIDDPFDDFYEDPNFDESINNSYTNLENNNFCSFINDLKLKKNINFFENESLNQSFLDDDLLNNYIYIKKKKKDLDYLLLKDIDEKIKKKKDLSKQKKIDINDIDYDFKSDLSSFNDSLIIDESINLKKNEKPSQKLYFKSSSSFKNDNNILNYIKDIDMFKHNFNNVVGLGNLNDLMLNDFLSISKSSFNPSRQCSIRKIKKDDNDIQATIELKYDGDLFIEVSVKILLNYPSDRFVSLPIKLKIFDIKIHSLVILAYINKHYYISFLCDIEDSPFENQENEIKKNEKKSFENIMKDSTSADLKERINIIKSVRIESEIGETEKNILRNVKMIEVFLIKEIRNLLRNEVAWPEWICLDFNKS